MSDARGAKRARTTAAALGKSAAPSRQSVAALLARLDRSALESLLAAAVTDGAAPTVAALEDALPARLRARGPPLGNGAGADVEALVTTGPFAALSADETLAIFALLPLKDKLTVLTAVCKGYGARASTLFRRCSDASRPHAAGGASCARALRPGARCTCLRSRGCRLRV